MPLQPHWSNEMGAATVARPAISDRFRTTLFFTSAAAPLTAATIVSSVHLIVCCVACGSMKVRSETELDGVLNTLEEHAFNYRPSNLGPLYVSRHRQLLAPVAILILTRNRLP